MRPWLLALPTAMLFCACFETGSVEPVPFDLHQAAFDFPTGQTRLMARTYTVETPAGKETSRDLGWYRFAKDTTFKDMPAKIVDGFFWEPYTDSVLRYQQRDLYVFEDSQVSVYTFKTKDGKIAYGPFLVGGLLKAAADDTDIFSDRVVELKYPLIGNRPWPIRPLADLFPNGKGLEKEYAGTDTLEFKGRKFVCGKMILHALGNTPIQTWISKMGLLKAEIDYGPFTMRDSLDDSIGTATSHESDSLLDVDIDSAAVAGYFERYGNGPFPREQATP